jgi:hypothetical protein
MARTAYRVGICTDGKRHAAIRRLLLQNQALCGAGRIVIKVDGAFELADLLACPRCQQLVRAEVQEGAAK